MSRKAAVLGGIAALLAVILLVGGLAILALVFRPFWIPSGAMKPTLLVGDYLVVSQVAYGFDCFRLYCPRAEKEEAQIPERGDVIVYRHPVSGYFFVGRVIGLPGDKVAMQDGQVSLNGSLVAQSPDGIFSEVLQMQGRARHLPVCRERVSKGEVCEKNQIVETLPSGLSYGVLDIGQSRADNTGPAVVPDGSIFVLGDNRDNSLDSRYSQAQGGVGMVPAQNVIGQARYVLFSFTGSHPMAIWQWRNGRLLERIQ